MKRALFGFLLVVMVGCSSRAPTAKEDVLFPPSMEPGTVDEAAANSIAERSVKANDADAKVIKLEARPEGKGWWVLVRLDRAGVGENRSIHIDDRGGVTNYGRGK